MEQVNHNSSQTTKDKLPTGLEGLIESLSAHISGLAHTATMTSEPSASISANDQTPVATNEISRLSDSSGDSSINSIGYVADTSELQQPYESPVKVGTTSNAAPLTPTANLKMLVAAASSAFDREQRESEDSKKTADDGDDPTTSRKLKSLALLCKRFLQVADEEIGPGKEFSLEMIANSLGINRRRIYDIINVLEALEMISKQSKNWYLWHGRGRLIYTLAKLKAMVMEDPDIAPYLENTIKPSSINNNNNCHQATSSENVSNSGDTHESEPRLEIVSQPENAPPKDNSQVVTAESNTLPVSCEITAEENDEQVHYNPTDFPFATRSVRYDKSLGVLCQKFVMLFLVSQDHEVTLEEAGRILVPDYQDDTIYMTLNPPVNPKTKVRRLYDIANILTSLGLIQKKVFVGPLHIKKPGYLWSGPSIEEIDRVLNSKKQEGSSKNACNKMKKSVSCRPFLHHYENMQGTDAGSPYCSPVKALGGSKFKRSLSFGGTATSTPRTSKMCSTPPIGNGRVLARPLCPKQVDYLREMKEFKSEMDKHAHRYPHVASIFHEFLQKYQSTLEQSASANGRFILPKTAGGQIDNQPQQPPCTCVTCSSWDAPCSSKDNGSTCTLTTPATDAVPITSPTSIQPVQTSQGIEAVASSVQESVPYTAAVPSSAFVTTLANSLLANILETIQNSAMSCEQSNISSTAHGAQTQPVVSTTTSTASEGGTTDSSTINTQSTTTQPLSEVQNIKDKGVVLSGTPPQKSFAPVDDVLIKQQLASSRVRPCNNTNNSSLVFGSLNPTTPKLMNMQGSSPVNCVPLSNKAAASVNPNAFLSASNLISEKENVSAKSFRYTEIGPSSEEKSPKRQRIC